MRRLEGRGSLPFPKNRVDVKFEGRRRKIVDCMQTTADPMSFLRGWEGGGTRSDVSWSQGRFGGSAGAVVGCNGLHDEDTDNPEIRVLYVLMTEICP